MATPTPSIGDELTVEVMQAVDGSRSYAVQPVDQDFLSDWRLLLRDRHGQLLKAGDRRAVWVLDVREEARELLVSSDDFGRVPISAPMRKRYLDAVRTVLVCAPDPPTDTSAVSEVQ